MSKLETLIQQLCPEGVEYKPLSELFDTRNGYTPSKGNLEFWTNGTIPWFRMEDIRENGRILSKATQYVSRSAVKGDLFPENSIIVATSATIGEHALITVPSLANQRFTYLMLKDQYKDCFSAKFLYYYCFKLDDYCKACLNQGNFASVDMKKFAKFEFPMVPLEIQREIVRILDNFTELTEKLIAELTARKKQFQFYHKQFFEFKKSDCIQIVCIKDICELLTGYPFDSSQFTATGIHLLRGMNIKRGILDYSESNNRYWNSVQGYEKFLLSTDDIVIAMDGSLVGKSYAQVKSNHLPSLLVQRVTRVRVTKANAHYIYHYISSGAFTRYVEKKKTGGAVPHISLKDIANFKIPLPSENMQKEIADSLDRFDALCNDLTSGLPAEIAARQKQYEYYRDKLLTFKKRS